MEKVCWHDRVCLTGSGAAPRWALEGLHPRQPDRKRPSRLLPLHPGGGHQQAHRWVGGALCAWERAWVMAGMGAALQKEDHRLKDVTLPNTASVNQRAILHVTVDAQPSDLLATPKIYKDSLKNKKTGGETVTKYNHWEPSNGYLEKIFFIDLMSPGSPQHWSRMMCQMKKLFFLHTDLWD